MGVSARLIRIETGPLRAALFTLWFPVQVAHFCISAIIAGRAKRLLEAECWINLTGVYLAVIDGAFVGMPVSK